MLGVGQRLSLSVKRLSVNTKALGTTLLGLKLRDEDFEDIGSSYRGLSLYFLKDLSCKIMDGDIADNVSLCVLLEDVNIDLDDMSHTISHGTTALFKRKLKGDKVLVNIPSFGDIAVNEFFVQQKKRKDWTTGDVLEYVVKRKAKLKVQNISFTSLIESRQPDVVGRPFQGVYVCQPHTTKFFDLIATLEENFLEKNQRKVFIWLDIFGANHNEVDEKLPLSKSSQERVDFLRSREYFLKGPQLSAIKRFGECILYLPALADPHVFRRAWCLWELYAVSLHRAKLTVLLGNQSHSPSRPGALAWRENFALFLANVNSIDIECNATCFYTADHFIIQKIANEHNIERVNKSIKSVMRRWALTSLDFACTKFRQEFKHGDTEDLLVICKLTEFQAQLLKLENRGLDAVDKFRELRQFLVRYEGENEEEAQMSLRAIAAIVAEDTQFDIEKLLSRVNKQNQSSRLSVRFSRGRKSVRAQSIEEEDRKSASSSSVASWSAASSATSSTTSSTFSKGSFRSLVSMVSRRSGSQEMMLDIALGSFDSAMAIYHKGLRSLKQNETQRAIDALGESVATLHRMKANIEEHRNISVRKINSLLINVLRKLTEVLYDEGMFAETRDRLEELIMLERDQLGEKNVDLARSYRKMALVQMQLGEYEQANDTASDALNVLYRIVAKNHVAEVAQVQSVLGQIAFKQGKLMDSLERFERALELFREDLGSDHHFVAETLELIALSKKTLGKKDDAISEQGNAVQVWESLRHTHGIRLGDAIVVLAEFFDESNDVELARKSYHKALQVYMEIFGENHIKVGRVHYSIGTLHLVANEPAKALTSYETALRIFTNEGHSDAGLTLNNIAIAYEKLGKYEAAFDAAKEALRVIEEHFGTGHPQTTKLRLKFQRISKRRTKKNLKFSK